MKLGAASVSFFAFAPLALALNDWSKPCFDGTCSYDVQQSSTSMAGSIAINGSPYSISDITTAAGWHIVNCTTTTNSQTIHMVCMDDSPGCSHLFQQGAQNTVVRLPESCGKGPFVRVASHWMPNNQSLPASVAMLRKRSGAMPQVHALQLDTNFTQVSASNENITMMIIGSTIPGAVGNAAFAPVSLSRRRMRDLHSRSLLSAIDPVLSGFSQLTSFNKTLSTSLPPINVNKNFPVFNESVSCANEQASINVDVDTSSAAQVNIGIVAAGTLIPPKIDEFAAFVAMNATVDGTIKLNANILGSLDSGSIQLFTVGIPGLDFADILKVGPTFNINAEAKATVDVELDMSIDINYDVNDLQLFFPPQTGHSSSANVSPQAAPIKLSVSPGVQSNAQLEAHLIPQVEIGLTVLKEAQANIFLNLDNAAILDLNLTAGDDNKVSSNDSASSLTNVEGCVDVKGEVSINAGATASFLGLFDSTTSVSLFNKTFDLFQSCFGSSTAPSSNQTANATTTSSTLTGTTNPTFTMTNINGLTNFSSTSTSSEAISTDSKAMPLPAVVARSQRSNTILTRNIRPGRRSIANAFLCPVGNVTSPVSIVDEVVKAVEELAS